LASTDRRSSSLPAALGGLVLLALVAGAIGMLLRGGGLPEPGSPTYEQVTRAFYRGLSALEVGLLDDARQQFADATVLVPEEPASWANLGLAHLRLGALEEATEPIERALALAPDESDLVLLASRAAAARGGIDAALLLLRQAVALDGGELRARFALADELQRLNTPEADEEALALLDEVVARAPDNLAALVERARIAARRGDVDRLAASRAAIGPLAATWPADVSEWFAAFEAAVDEENFDDAARATTFLRNVLRPVPAFRESLASVQTPVERIAEPLDRFLELEPPPARPAPADATIVFASEPVADTPADLVLALFPTIESPPELLAGGRDGLRTLDGSGAWPYPSVGGGLVATPASASVAALDWNHDFLTDVALAADGGLRLLLQGEDGGFTDATAEAAAGVPLDVPLAGVWAADVEMDGDLDVIAGPVDGAPIVLRNNGDTTWIAMSPFADVTGVRAFAWADLDGDGDADAAFVDRAGTLHVFTNRQVGRFDRVPGPDGLTGVVAVAAADLDADGGIDVVALDDSGTLHRVSWIGARWSVAGVATWAELVGASPGSHRVLVADLDNNGALDVVAAGGGATRVWLSDGDHTLALLPEGPAGEVFAAVDRDEDGRLDLAGLVDGRPAWLMGGGGTAGYHWKGLRPRGQPRAGDQRINSFGVGGSVGVRSGLLVQTQVLTGGPVHFGLGTQTDIDVARIVWPNGIAQAEFGLGVDDVILVEQRLSGSCPWVFAWDGSRMGFVTDFLWRSPLGLRINAQDTAGVSQTEDWVRIRGDQLVPRDGFYDVRITAELWETHFFDHVSLMVVDHPAGTEVYVDERFAPARPQAQDVRAVRIAGPVPGAWDENGRDVTDLVAARDGRHLATFPYGPYQGIAEEHFVEIDTAGLAGLTRPLLVATGWVYPTNSSINVAIGQGTRVRPGGLALEAQDPGGTWTVVDPDLGFPAGKNKTMLIDLAEVRHASRLRLRTNLEVYWDALALAEEVDAPARAVRLDAASSELRYRGYSETVSPRGESPETPIYERIANTVPRWRDLTGYYTRFGSVNPLLASVDDRYVIMNAGDELRLRFEAPPEPEEGWSRDFVLIGDGWEKDGDFNTEFSDTVLPLPSHDTPAYGTAGMRRLEDDPVFRRHRADWEEYHTRFVTPHSFTTGLRGAGRPEP